MSRRLQAVLVAAAAALVYARSLDHGFVWDDHILIEANPALSALLSPAQALRAAFKPSPVEPFEGAARPFLMLSLHLDRAAWGFEPGGYHLTNVLLHVLNSVLALLLGLRFLAPGSAMLGALAFAVHPINTEAVNAISFRADLLAALFVLASCLAALEARRAARARPRAAWLLLSAAGYGLGLLSKEMAATTPLLIWLLSRATAEPSRFTPRWRGAALAAYLLVAGGYLGFRQDRSGYRLETGAGAAKEPARGAAAPDGIPGGSRSFHPAPPPWAAVYRDRWLNFLMMSSAAGDYGRLLVVPYPLHADRAPRVPASAADPGVWLGLGLLAAALAASVGLRERQPAVSAGIAWALAAAIPIANVVPLYNPVAERYLYLISIGAAWALAGAVEALAGAARPARLAFGCLSAALLIPYAAWTWQRGAAWRSDEALFGAERSTENARVHFNLALLRERDGRPAEAETEYRRAAALHPRYVEALINLGALLERRGRGGEAEKLYEGAVALAPASPIPYDVLGGRRLAQGRTLEALRLFKSAVELDPWYVAARMHEGEAYAKLGMKEKALGSFSEAQRRDPHQAQAAYNRGMLLEELGRRRAAVVAFKDVLELEPRHRDATMNLGVTLHHAGDHPAAAAWLERAVVLDPGYAPALYNLAMAEQSRGKLGAARRRLEEATALAPAYADAWYALGVVSQAAGKVAEAEQAYRRAVELEPGRLEPIANLGGLLELEGRLEEAAAVLERARALEPRPAVLNNLGNVRLKLGGIEAAARLYLSAIEQAARYGDSLKDTVPAAVNLGICLYRMGRRDEAVAYWRRATEAAPGYGLTYQWLARAHEADGRLKEAEEAWTALLRIEPGNRLALAALKR